jgi:hypothetical protein
MVAIGTLTLVATSVAFVNAQTCLNAEPIEWVGRDGGTGGGKLLLRNSQDIETAS